MGLIFDISPSRCKTTIFQQSNVSVIQIKNITALPIYTISKIKQNTLKVILQYLTSSSLIYKKFD